MYSNATRIACRGKMHLCMSQRYSIEIVIFTLSISLRVCFWFEFVHLVTHNICFGWEITKIIFRYTLLSGG